MLISLFFGVIGLIIPVVSIFKKGEEMNRGIAALLSMGSCGMAILGQLLAFNGMVKVSDWAGLMDTVGTSVVISGVLLLLTVILNLIALRGEKK